MQCCVCVLHMLHEACVCTLYVSISSSVKTTAAVGIFYMYHNYDSDPPLCKLYYNMKASHHYMYSSLVLATCCC